MTEQKCAVCEREAARLRECVDGVVRHAISTHGRRENRPSNWYNEKEQTHKEVAPRCGNSRGRGADRSNLPMRRDSSLPKICAACGRAFTTRRNRPEQFLCSRACKDVLVARRAAERRPVVLWTRVERGDPAECWPYRGGTNNKGYGRVGHRYAHRMAWELTNGPIPSGLIVCHRCDNPPCCNPDHLFLGTVKDNAEDMVRKGRDRHTKNGTRLPPPPGKTFGERHATAKLKEADIAVVRGLAAAGVKYADIAARYGMHPSAICRVVNGKTWRHHATPVRPVPASVGRQEAMSL